MHKFQPVIIALTCGLLAACGEAGGNNPAYEMLTKDSVNFYIHEDAAHSVSGEELTNMTTCVTNLIAAGAAQEDSTEHRINQLVIGAGEKRVAETSKIWTPRKWIEAFYNVENPRDLVGDDQTQARIYYLALEGFFKHRAENCASPRVMELKRQRDERRR